MLCSSLLLGAMVVVRKKKQFDKQFDKWIWQLGLFICKRNFLLIKDPHICCPQIMHGILREYCDIQWHGSWLRCTFLMRVQYCLFAAQYLCNGK